VSRAGCCLESIPRLLGDAGCGLGWWLQRYLASSLALQVEIQLSGKV